MITGKIAVGCGRASKIREDIFQARCKAAGVRLVRGTVNVSVADLEDAISALGTPRFETDKNNRKLGPLRWWRVKVFGEKLPATGIEAFVVRHKSTRTKYLEMMGDVYFRELNLENGEVVHIELIDAST